MMIIKSALDKLEEGAKGKINDKYGAVIKTYVHSALAGFCKQNESFAQAVLDGGTFAECIKYCTQGIGGTSEFMFGSGAGISDVDIYRRAVQFYFPGAQVDFHISIITEGAETRIYEDPQREEVKTKTAKSEEKKPKTKESITKTEESITKTEKPKRKSSISERKPKKQDSNIIQLDLFA